MPQDLKKAQTYGGRKICFENDEVSEMKQFEDPGKKIFLMSAENDFMIVSWNSE